MHINLPLTDEVVKDLKKGDYVYLSGIMYIARDAAHKRLVDSIQSGEALPMDLVGQTIYYAGPAPAKPGEVIGSVGPTTAYRMDPYAPTLLDHGLKGMIGKGRRNDEVMDAIKRNTGVYFVAIGGAAALISKTILSQEIIAYEDLGAEALRRIEVKDFPAIVANDIYGGDLYNID
jgi:fumarate hydratase subunit beta